MKLRRVRLENFRRFRAPLLLEGFSDGLNIIAAPNEAGKSTVAEAIRAAFFERHKTTSVESLRPWGDSAASPSIELDFELGGRQYRLSKSFLGRKRCDLQMEGQPPLDGAAAEDHLAALLGFRFAGKGASAPEHMGIPGLLWIRQGSSHELSDPVHHAAEHLRQVLGTSLGELASSTGDALLRRVEADRHELLTPAAGHARGELAAALTGLADAEQRLGRLNDEVLAYCSRVDQLATMRREHLRAEQERPWERLREQHLAAQTRLDAADRLQARVAASQASLRAWEAQATASRAELDALAKDDAALQARVLAEQRIAQEDAAAALELQAWERRHLDAVRVHEQALARLQQVRAAQARAEALRSMADLESAVASSDHALARAQEARTQHAQQLAEAQALAVSPQDLAQLQQLSSSLRDNALRQEAVATLLELDIPAGQTLLLDGVAHQGQQRLAVLRRTAIELPGAARLWVTPGGSDLPTLALQQEQLQLALAQRLQRLGVPNVADAEARARRAAQRQQDAQASRQLLDALAPQGVEALQAELAQRRARLASLRSAAAQAEAASGACLALAVPDAVPAAQAAHEKTQTQLQTVQAQLNSARLLAARAQSSLSAARQECAAAQATLADPLRTQRLQAASLRLSDCLAQQSAENHRLRALTDELRTLNPSLLQQDVQRYAAAAQLQEQAHAARHQAFTRLEVELETRGALGLEEQQADAQRDAEVYRRRAEQLQRRADALDHLLQLLRRHRAQLAQRLRAPLQRHLSHYLQMAFPGAQIEVADDLVPGAVERGWPHGTERGPFDQLSQGAREQLGIISRLAYADLLRDAGRPTLILLDDALVHTDEDRLAQMKRVLYDAAQRHQLLLFTCHSQAWQDMGVPLRGLA